ncbi:MAG: A24 family peptidase [Myxococcaceae bacterium]
MPLKFLLFGVLGVALLISVLTDIASRRILDLVTWPAMAICLLLRLWEEGLGDLEHGLVSGLVGVGGGAGLFALLAAWKKSFGWGDVKLMAAVGAAFGYPLIMAGLLFVSLTGALQAVVSLIWQGAVWDTLRGLIVGLGKKLKLTKETETQASRHIPYGVAIALGSVWAMWWDGTGGSH